MLFLIGGQLREIPFHQPKITDEQWKAIRFRPLEVFVRRLPELAVSSDAAGTRKLSQEETFQTDQS
jgi:hypothetical protein